MALSATLGHFKLLEEIGRGGMGTVFKAFDPTLDRHVAIKVLNEELSRDPKFVEDFLREARNAAAISHPHIVQVHFCGDVEGQFYVVMELLKGRSLRELSETGGPLGEEQALQLASDVAEALRAAYQTNKMIHGDIKPANIFVTDDAGAKVLDFGLAKLANVEVPAAGEIWGSPFYISPERVGQKAEDFRSDIYSLGATLFHVITGRPPFDAETPEELVVKRLNEKPPLLRELKPDITEQTEQVVNKMLSKNPLTRFRDYDHLLDQLKQAKDAATAKRLGIQVFTGEQAAQLKAPAPAVAAAAPAKKFPVVPVVAGGSVVIAALIGVIVFLMRGKPQPTPVAPAASIVVTQTVTQAMPPPAATTAPSPSVTSLAPTNAPTAEELAEKARKAAEAKAAATRKHAELVDQETNLVQTTEAQLAPLWQTYDFTGLTTQYQNLAAQLKTSEAKKLVAPKLSNVKLLTEFKAQLINDIAAQPYTRRDLRTRNGGAVDGNLKAATDTQLTFMTPYGQLDMKWADLPPLTLLLLAKSYAAAPNASDPDNRKKLMGVFSKQYKVTIPKPVPTPKPTPTPTTPPPPKPPTIKHLVH